MEEAQPFFDKISSLATRRNRVAMRDLTKKLEDTLIGLGTFWDDYIPEDYITDFCKDLPQETIERQESIENIRLTMQKYGENKWWESNDPATRSLFQLFEDIRIIDFFEFGKGLCKLLGRSVWNFELGINTEGLRREAGEALERYNATGEYNIPTHISEEKTAQALVAYANYCEKEGVPFIPMLDANVATS